MQVSAINVQNDCDYKTAKSAGVFNNRYKETIGDTSFNSLIPYSSNRKTDRLPMVFDSVNQWKNFCHQRILGGKLDIIA